MKAVICASRTSAEAKSPRRRQRSLEGVEPEFDLILSQLAWKRQVVDDQATGMGVFPGADVGSLVCVEIVEDEMDHLTFGDLLVEQVEECEEDRFGASRREHSDDLSGVHKQAGGEAAGAMAFVLDFSA